MRYLSHIVLLLIIAAGAAVSPITTQAVQNDFMGSGSNDGTTGSSNQSGDANSGGNGAYPGFSNSTLSTSTPSITSSDSNLPAGQASNSQAALLKDPTPSYIKFVIRWIFALRQR